jgi:uncharacterized protein (TIGR02145 family)
MRILTKLTLTAALAFAITFTISCSSGDSGTFKDSRDKQKYKYIKIGDQTWMAENLNFAAEGSKCYSDIEENCQKHGRLYSWEMAMKSCPDGWHLPSDAEWKTLTDAAGGDSIAGAKLKAKEGWINNSDSVKVDNKLGFSALPGSYAEILFPNGGYRWIPAEIGYWWSTVEQSLGFAYTYYIKGSVDSIKWEGSDKADLRSVRCVQNIKTEQAKEEVKEQPAAIEIVYDTLTDSRDKNKYKTITIGDYTWMAENLNYNAKGSECYGNDPENCKKYGRLYPDYDVCPSGWHKSTINEWEALGKDATKLRAKEGWNSNGNGSDNFGIAALPGGYGNKNGSFSEVGNYGIWWVSQPGSLAYDYFGYCIHSSKNSAFAGVANSDLHSKISMLSIRCVKNYKCGKTTYNPIPSMACCDDKTTYDYSTKFCYKGKVYALCGEMGSEYNPDTQVCYKNSDVLDKKCDGKSYKYDMQICRNGKILEKCGYEGYDPTKEYCSEGNVMPAYGYMTDAGGKAYRTTKIGEQVWMAENMNYGLKDSKCYDNKPANCTKYGRLYNWEMAKKNTCPKGWHLPIRGEWETLVNTAGGEEAAVRYLMAMSGWDKMCLGDSEEECYVGGTDKYGFSALPGGLGIDYDFSYVGAYSYWWSASDEGYDAYILSIDYYGGLSNSSLDKNYFLSVRCVQN